MYLFENSIYPITMHLLIEFVLFDSFYFQYDKNLLEEIKQSPSFSTIFKVKLGEFSSKPSKYIFFSR